MRTSEVLLREQGVDFEVNKSGGVLSFHLRLAEPGNAAQDGYLSDVVAKKGEKDYATVAKRKWAFFSSSRHPTVVYSLRLFLAWWDDVLKPKELAWVKKRYLGATADVGLPSDILNIISSQLTNLEYMRLALCSRAWMDTLDREEAWQRRWFDSQIVLSTFSLASCDSFKERIALVHIARKNILNRIGTLYQTRRDEEMTLDSWSNLSSNAMDVPVGSSFTGHALKLTTYSGGSHSSTRHLNQTFVDLSAFPRSTKRVVLSDDRMKSCRFVAPNFITRDMRKSADLTMVFESVKPCETANRKQLLPRVSFSPVAGDVKVEAVEINKNSDFPWVIIRVKNSNKGNDWSVYDFSTRSWLCEKQDWGSLGISGLFHFWGPYIVAYDERASKSVYRFDVASRKIVLLRPGSFLRDIRIPGCEREYAPSQHFSGGYIWIVSDKKVFFSRIKFSDLESGYTDDELRQIIVDNHVKCSVESNMIRFFELGNISVGGDGRYGMLTDLKTKQQVGYLGARYRLYFIQWIDATTISVECDHDNFLIDYACRSIETGKPDQRSVAKLPSRKCRYAVITSDPSSKVMNVHLRTLHVEKLQATLLALFNDQPLKMRTIAPEAERDIGIDSIRPSTLIWMPAQSGEPGGPPSIFEEVVAIDRAPAYSSTEADPSAVSAFFAMSPYEKDALAQLEAGPRPSHSRSRYATRPAAEVKAEDEDFAKMIRSRIDGKVEAVVLVASRPKQKWCMFYEFDEAHAVKAFEAARSQK
eukprot:TRINITY_DN1501_c0_g1_i2.p1 TRINITY_DN1501_c0_g1~~TRINITY_DN1501_c0_g1_i2.p1  ORF type:complete len:755 (-),score=104.62 TRINITY_DN1501_c0_g1_i2:814-3078(-)